MNIPVDDNDVPPPPPAKVKVPRASRACTTCRKLKMKCYDNEEPPCKRCRLDNQACIFPESQRGKHRNGGRKSKQTLLLRAAAEAAAKAAAAGGSITQADPPIPSVAAVTVPWPSTSSADSCEHDITVSTLPPMSYQHTPFIPAVSPQPSSTSLAQFSNHGGSPDVFMPPLRQQRLNELLQSPSPSHLPAPLPPQTSFSSDQLRDIEGIAYLDASTEQHLLNLFPDLAASVSNLGRVGSISGSDIPDAASPSVSSSSVADSSLAPQTFLQIEGIRNRGLKKQGDTLRCSEGVGSEAYFDPPVLEDLGTRRALIASGFHAPEVLDHVSTAQVHGYFNFYFANLHPHFPVLCPTLHTPDSVAGRSPLLLTVCAIASRFMEPTAEITIKIAKICGPLVFAVPSRGAKTVEIVQACLLLSIWSVNSSGRPREENTSVLLSLAKSIGQDLGLDLLKAPLPESNGRRDEEYYNRARTWLCCFLYDNYLAIQLGHPPTIKDQLVTRVPLRFMKSSGNPLDLYPCYETDLLRLLTQTVVSPSVESDVGGFWAYVSIKTVLQAAEETSAHRGCDYSIHIAHFNNQLKNWKERLDCADFNISTSGTGAASEVQLLPQAWLNLLYNYARLVVYSYGLKAAIDNRQPAGVGMYFPHCYSAATATLWAIQNEYAPHGWLKYAPDHIFVIVSYAAVALLRFCRPQLQNLQISVPTVMDLVHSTVDTIEAASASGSQVSGQHAGLLRQIIHAQEQGLRVVTRVSSPRPPSPEPMDSGQSRTSGVSVEAFDAYPPLDQSGTGMFTPMDANDSSDLFGGLTLSLSGLWEGVLGDEAEERWDWPYDNAAFAATPL